MARHRDSLDRPATPLVWRLYGFFMCINRASPHIAAGTRSEKVVGHEDKKITVDEAITCVDHIKNTTADEDVSTVCDQIIESLNFLKYAVM